MKHSRIILIVSLLAIIASIFTFSYFQKGSNEPQNTINTTVETQKEAQIPETTPEEPKILESDLDTSTWKTYRNDELGVEFKYPQNLLGNITIDRLKGCDSRLAASGIIEDIKPTKEDPCEVLVLRSSKKNGIFAGSTSVSYHRTLPPSEYTWPQLSFRVEDVATERFCKYSIERGYTKVCTVYKNSYNTTVTKHVQTMEYEEIAPGIYGDVYFVHLAKNKAFPSITFSGYNLGSMEKRVESDRLMAAIMATLKVLD